MAVDTVPLISSVDVACRLPSYAKFIVPHAPHTSLRGGRSSSKTSTIARLMVKETRLLHEARLMMCCREYQNSIEDSAKAALEEAIVALGVEKDFRVLEQKIVCRNNGAEIHFAGLAKLGQAIKGWHRPHWTWVEEAQSTTHKTAEILVPTCLRADGSRMFWSWNPDQRTDFVWQRFVESPEDGDISILVNYTHNPFLPESSRRQAEAMKKSNPIRYRHIWLGEPDDGGGDDKILAYDVLMACVRAYKLGHAPSREDAPICEGGLDIADAGDNLNALVVRRGPTIEHVEIWATERAGYLTPTARRAHEQCMRQGVWRLTYDATGIGAPLREAFGRLNVPYITKPVGFGDKVAGPKRMYEKGHTNEMTFNRRNAQMAFALKLRGQRTQQLLMGEDVDPATCLFIHPDCVDNLTMSRYLAELSRPLWRKNTWTGKIEIDKRGEENEKSPDSYDATALAFSWDSDSGLRAF